MADPVVLHAALLALINEYMESMIADDYPAPMPLVALRAVVELHRPEPCSYAACRSTATHKVCAECGAVVNWPCNTIEKITGELGVSTS